MTGYGFPSRYKLLKTDEFSSVFSFRRRLFGVTLALHSMPNTFGYPRIGIVVNKKVARAFCDTITNIPEVTECYNISGRFDYLLKVHSPNMKYYQEFVLDVLGSIPNLGTIESTFVMEEVKHKFGVSI